MNKEKLIKGKLIFHTIATVVTVILLFCLFIQAFFLTIPPDKNIPQEEYGITIPFKLENVTNRISTSHEINTTLALFGVNITYKFRNIGSLNSINFSTDILTTFNIWIIAPYLSWSDIYENIELIVLRGMGKEYELLWGTSEYGEKSIMEYLGKKEITTIGSRETLNIGYPSYVSIFVNGSGWNTKIFDADIGLNSIIVNQDKIQEAEKEYRDKYALYEKEKTQKYLYIGLLISGIAVIHMITAEFDNYIQFEEIKKDNKSLSE